MKQGDLLLVKVGTDVQCRTTKEGRVFCQQAVTDIARQCAAVIERGIWVELVVSGAMQVGRELFGDKARSDKLLASHGQIKLMQFWSEALARHNIATHQLLATEANWQDRLERESLRSAIVEMCRHGDVPIINENDPVSQIEIQTMRKGLSDNDELAARVARCTDADAVLFLTTSGGLYDRDPNQEETARRYAEVDARASAEDLGIAATTSTNGRGGMSAKFVAGAKLALADIAVGVGTYQQDGILRFVEGHGEATIIGNTTRFAQV